MINATGNSMSPTIGNGDKLVVEHWNGDQIQDNKIYVFCYNSEFFVKRLSKNIDEIIIKSDNPEYRVRTIPAKALNDLTLIGKIVAVIKNLD
jgi:phage repressor protein C with HTH and peptisase S24 domain